MPTVAYVEKTIFEIEGVRVDFVKNGKNVRSEVDLPYNYNAKYATMNSANVSFLKEKLKKQYPGYDFIVYNYNGEIARGNVLLANLRDTYLKET
ncbi:hypothetical protein CLHUN_02350 [Ruminiclostridium hungatei]|uniref:Uncharacterized protein n=1 Tax=Ruminiclostridium hungatei TaxID=48256 RepID=A0A1V4SR92_RUMHU|nr:hypothetical protein [Ruminiclostridium hungatei]OPX46419.1 hypothetical protein CLHUN_02350 [Ruminiclostridium hungatei]